MNKKIWLWNFFLVFSCSVFIEVRILGQNSEIEKLPAELQTYIASFLASAKNLKQAIRNIKALSLVNKHFYNLINTNMYFILKNLANKHNTNVMDVAFSYGTIPAALAIKDHLDENLKARLNKKLISLLNRLYKIYQDQKTGDSQKEKAMAIERKEILKRIALSVYAGADVNIQSKEEETPLHILASTGDIPLINLFLKSGAEVNILDDEGHLPIHHAAMDGHTNIVDLLFNSGSRINEKDKDDLTILHHAVMSNKEDLVKYLLSLGIAQTPNQEGILPIHYAESPEVAKLLLSSTNINAQDDDGKTPLIWAASNGNKELVKFLLESGADKSIPDKSGTLPIHYSTSVQVTKMFLDAGVPVDVQDNFGNTPLHYAVSSVNPELVELLVSRGADTTISNYNNDTPLDIASNSGDDELIELLKQ